MKLTIHEIYSSVQGESTWVGMPCTFIRTTFCDLRCSYCDTAHAFYQGTKMEAKEILEKVEVLGCRLIEVTGGEPLLQKGIFSLMTMLCDRGFQVLLETSGAHDISAVDPRVYRIMDLKTPSSGENLRNYMENILHLTEKDEVKFVLGSREDYEWARKIIREKNIHTLCKAVLMSPVFGKISPSEIVHWILQDQLPVRFQLQIHKFIWDPHQRGV